MKYDCYLCRYIKDGHGIPNGKENGYKLEFLFFKKERYNFGINKKYQIRRRKQYVEFVDCRGNFLSDRIGVSVKNQHRFFCNYVCLFYRVIWFGIEAIGSNQNVANCNFLSDFFRNTIL